MNQQTFSSVIAMFTNEKDKHDESLQMHDLLIQHKGHRYHHHFTKEPSPSDIRSISKTIMTIVLGVVIRLSEEGKYAKLSEETFIYPIIKDAIQLETQANEVALKKVKLKHLLTHTVGFNDVLMMRDDIKDMDPFEYVNYIVNYPIVHEPGDYYLYSNAGFYLLSVVLQEFLKENLLTFIQRELFDPLGIKNAKWEKYGNYLAGATRLWLRPEELLKVGELLLHNGTVDEKELITRSWIERMLTVSQYTPKSDTADATFRRYAYGHGIWLAKDGFYFGHGTDGQTLTVIPSNEMIIITLASQPDMKPIEKVINHMIECEL